MSLLLARQLKSFRMKPRERGRNVRKYEATDWGMYCAADARRPVAAVVTEAAAFAAVSEMGGCSDGLAFPYPPGIPGVLSADSNGGLMLSSGDSVFSAAVVSSAHSLAGVWGKALSSIENLVEAIMRECMTC